LSAVYFATRDPQATVVAIEPEAANFKILCRNAREYPNIKPIPGGLWKGRGQLGIANQGAESWGFQVSENSDGETIPAFGVRDIIDLFGVSKLDILKLDIEGSEVEVLSQTDSWIHTCGTMIIELHDRFRPGCSDALTHALADYQFERGEAGEKTIISGLTKRSTTT
jgi:FkbM family methyltransferase